MNTIKYIMIQEESKDINILHRFLSIHNILDNLFFFVLPILWFYIIYKICYLLYDVIY